MLVLLVAGISCHEQNDTAVLSDEFMDVYIPDAYKAGLASGRADYASEEVIREIVVIKPTGEKIYGKAKLTLSVEGEHLIKFQMTQNLFQETGLTPDFWLEGFSKLEGGKTTILNIGDCLSKCNSLEKSEKGWCKAGCWIGFAASVAVVVIAIV